MNDKIRDRIRAVRDKMKGYGITAYVVVSDDFHASEYVGDYFKCREYLSGFDGSAGTLVILPEEAGLWTDGRYFLQAEEQLAGTGITLYKSGNEGVPTIPEFLAQKLKPDETLGFDGRTVSDSFFREIRKKTGEKIKIRMDVDLAGEVWTDRPELPEEPVFILEEPYSGCSMEEKVRLIREKLKEKKADCTLIASLDDIAWLLNIRGNDIEYNPVVLSYLYLDQNTVKLYVNQKKLNDTVQEYLKKNQVELRNYEEFYTELEKIPEQSVVLVDPARINAASMNSLTGRVKLLEADNLTLLPKAEKNPVEVENERQAHIKDGVAVTRFIYWLKKQICRELAAESDNAGAENCGQKSVITEISAAEKLDEFRKQGSHYLGQSFAPIAAYGAHGAIVHYEASEETDVVIKPESFLLLDTGGHYLEGTTDITRTIALGKLTEEQKRNYTAVLRGNLNLAAARFKYGCHGVNLDYLAREPLWERGMDYNHGTGHGVGYLLNVHEGPNAIRNKELSGDNSNQVLEEGMITSDEPGLYLAGQYGIRLENLMLCKKTEKNEYGQFMEFETLTMVPFDLDAILTEELSEKEKAHLNAYHKKVYETIAPFLPEEEQQWLKNATRAV